MKKETLYDNNLKLYYLEKLLLAQKQKIISTYFEHTMNCFRTLVVCQSKVTEVRAHLENYILCEKKTFTLPQNRIQKMHKRHSAVRGSRIFCILMYGCVYMCQCY